MMRILAGTFCAALSFMMACSNKDKSRKNLLPELAACDSAAVMYYKTAGNPRFFTLHKFYDKQTIKRFDEAVNQKVITGKDSCVTDGKIYFYGKGGAVYPVYFSRTTTCLALSFVKTGEKYYTRMSEDIKKMLDDWQRSAIELPSAVE